MSGYRMYEENEEPVAIGHRTVTDASVMTFGCLTGDYARMHFDHGITRGAPIAHGLLSASWSLGALTLQAPERLAIGNPAAFLGGYRVRFERPVHVGDRFSLRWSEGSAACVDGLASGTRRDTDFEIRNQHDETTATGSLSVCITNPEGTPAPPPPLQAEARAGGSAPTPLFAEDLLEFGPRGESLGRTVTEADLVAYAGFTGELNPAYLNQEFAGQGPFGATIAPPMWTFCLAFGDFLRGLLEAPLPSSDFAGHLGDSWRFLAPVRAGDTIRTRYEPITCRASRSRSGQAIVEFALQLLNQRDEIVQDGRVAMMIAMRPQA